MKIHRRSLSAFLIATSALIAPHGFAQEAPVQDQQAGEAAEPQTPPVEEERDVVVVQGNFIPEPLQETSEVAAFLTMEDLDRQGDSNAAEALARVTGLSISEGRFVYVRGLGERYSSAMLNGSPLPSPEPLQRVVPLDLFPDNILGGVMVQKSYSAEFPGEFGGGVVALSTVGMPRSPFFEVGVGAGMNTETTLATGYTHDGGEADQLGFDDGLRKTPFRIREAWIDGKRIGSGNFSPVQLQDMGQSLENAKLRLTQINDAIPGNFSADASTGQIFDIGANRLGFVGVLGYTNDWETKDGIQQAGRVETSLGAIQVKDDYNYTSTDNNVGWNALLGTGFEFGESNVKWTNLWIHRTTKETYRRFGFDEGAGSNILTERTAWYERELFSSQLAGLFDFGDLDVNWRAAWAQTSREAPYEWEVRYLFDPSISRYLYDASSRVRNQTNFSDLSDEVGSSGLDLTYSFANLGLRDTVLSAGLAHSDNARKSDSHTLRFNPAEALPLAVQQSRVDFLFADFNINPNRFVVTETTGADGAAAYDANLEVISAYTKLDFEPLQFFRVSLGARAERGIQHVTPRSLFDNEAAPAAAPKNKEAYILPAATVTWNFADDQQFRLGVSQTIGRPQFRELAAQKYLDPDSDRIFFGNPFLRDSKFDNVDARYEFFFGPQQYFTVGAFYKDIYQPVESIVVQQGNTVQQSYINAPSAQILGGEIEIKKVFDEVFKEGWLAPYSFLVQANYTYSDSELKAASGDTIITPSGSVVDAASYITVGSRLQGQSEHVANLQIGFEDESSQGTLLVTYVSERSTARGPEGQPDIIQEPGVIMDFVYRKDIEVAGHEVTLKFKAGNLLDEDHFESQSLGGGEVIVNQYDLGRSFSVGATAKF